MKLKPFISQVLIASTLLFIACGGSDGGDNGPDPTPVEPPTAATLSQPANNEVCLTGISINDEQSRVPFSWSNAANTTSYSLVVKNLNTDEATTYAATTSSTEVTLLKGTPYSWYVVSRSNQTTQTANSATWKFYLAGDGITEYAPFPATLVAPASGATVNRDAGTVDLVWTGEDVDGDIASYDVYLDTVDGNTTKIGTAVTTETLENIAVTANTVYYWKVITTDEAGNTSSSPVLSFRTGN